MTAEKIKSKPNFPTYTAHPKKRNVAVLVETIKYFDSRLPNGELEIPAGYITDGASIPRPFRWFIGQPMSPQFWKASLIHDYLYSNKIGKQKNADNIFLELLHENNVGKIRRFTMWGALRMFGWIWWKL